MSFEQLLAPARRAEIRNIQAVLAGQAPRRFRSTTRQASGAWMDVTLALEPCLDSHGSVIAVTLRCEPVARTRSKESPVFDAASGTRPILAPTQRPPKPPVSRVAAQTLAPRPETSPPREVSEPPTLARVEGVRPLVPSKQPILTEDGAAQLETALQLLGWLRTCIADNEGPFDAARDGDRRRALIVLNDTADLIAECRSEMKRG